MRIQISVFGVQVKIILALDISSVATGYAIMTDDGNLVEKNVFRMRSKDSHPNRMCQLQEKINSLIETYKPDIFGIEDVFLGRNVKTMKVLSWYRGVAELTWFKYNQSPAIIYSPSELRRKIQKATGVVMTGKRKKNKSLVFDFIVKKYNLKDFKFETHNDVCDAIALGLAISLPVVKRATKKEKARVEALRLKAETREAARIVREKLKEEKAMVLAAARELKKELAKNAQKPKSI